MAEDQRHNEAYRDSVEDRQEEQKQKLLDALKNMPILAMAAQKIGVSRSTVYRWMAIDAEFKRDVAASQEEGRGNVNDLMESRLLKIADGGNLGAVKFYLQHNHESYQPKPIFDRERAKIVDRKEEAAHVFEELLDIKYAADGDPKAKRRMADKDYLYTRIKEAWRDEVLKELEKARFSIFEENPELLVRIPEENPPKKKRKRPDG